MINQGIIGHVNAGTVVVAPNGNINIGANGINTQWNAVDQWLIKNSSQIERMNELQKQVDILKEKIADGSLTLVEKKSMFQTIKDVVGLSVDANELIGIFKQIIDL
jgi:hypothetical protein